MADPSETGDYVWLSGVRIWWNPKEPQVVHLAIDDPDLVHPQTRLGAWISSSTNKRSANYHPGNFNRFARVLRKYGKSAPDDDAPEGPRRWDKR